MSQNSILLKAFNKHLFEFIDEVIKVFPEKSEIVSSRDYLDTLKKTNPTIIIKIWKTNINDQYKSYIDSGDIDFFLNKDYSTDFEKLPMGKDIAQLIDSSLRQPLRNLDSSNKKQFLSHFQLLSNLCEKYSM